MPNAKLQESNMCLLKFVWTYLDYALLLIYTIILVWHTGIFAEDMFLARVYNFDDWLLAQHLQQLFINSIQQYFGQF